jgi:predicted nuclease of predicted toxin-antitoxin system
MNFLADEGVDRAIVVRLRDDGCDVTYIAEIAGGTTDEVILHMAMQENRILITHDKDFGDLAYRDGRWHAGILLNRLNELPSLQKAALVSNLVKMHGHELIGAFTVLQPGKIRIRKLRPR